MTATTKFYTGFFIALALVVALSYYVGYRAGYGGTHPKATHAIGAGARP